QPRHLGVLRIETIGDVQYLAGELAALPYRFDISTSTHRQGIDRHDAQDRGRCIDPRHPDVDLALTARIEYAEDADLLSLLGHSKQTEDLRLRVDGDLG